VRRSFRDLALLALRGFATGWWSMRRAFEINRCFGAGCRSSPGSLMPAGHRCQRRWMWFEMVLAGRVNKQIVNGLNRLGGRAVWALWQWIWRPGSKSEGLGDGSTGWWGCWRLSTPDVPHFPCWRMAYIPSGISSVGPTPSGQSHNISMPTTGP